MLKNIYLNSSSSRSRDMFSSVSGWPLIFAQRPCLSVHAGHPLHFHSFHGRVVPVGVREIKGLHEPLCAHAMNSKHAYIQNTCSLENDNMYSTTTILTTTKKKPGARYAGRRRVTRHRGGPESPRASGPSSPARSRPPQPTLPRRWRRTGSTCCPDRGSPAPMGAPD